MGKKHKKHHKSDKRSHEEKPLKLVLKVGSSGQDRDINYSEDKFNIDEPFYENTTKEHHHKSSKKKKKKKSHEKHRHHDRKEKSSKKRDRDFEGDHEVEEPLHPPPAPPPLKTFIPPVSLSLPERRLQPARTCRDRERDPDNPLKKLLEILQKQLQRKDPNQFFAWPVTDMIAPGYSSIIQHPMDFSTLQHKVDTDEYDSVDEYKADVKQMCDNAMIYNRPETVYFKAAKKLLSYSYKIMSKEHINSLKRAVGFDIDELEIIPVKVKKHKREEILPEDSTVDVDIIEHEDIEHKPKKRKMSKESKYEEEEIIAAPVEEEMEGLEEIQDDDDGITAEEIIEQATYAAHYAKDKLSRKYPNSKIGFLRKGKDGTTTLAVVNPDSGIESGEEVHPVNLGVLVGKLTAGSSSIAGFREDKRNKVNPVSYLMYGPFGSHAPTYDSTFATISKEDSDLLFSTYKDETGIQYAKSLQSFVKDTGDYAIKLANGLLDTLTNGEHSKTMRVLQEKQDEEEKRIREAEKKKHDLSDDKENKDVTSDSNKQTDKPSIKEEPASKEPSFTESNSSGNVNAKETSYVKEEEEDQRFEPLPEIDFEALKSLSDIGIDMSFLPAMEKELNKENTSTEGGNVQEKLNETGDLIKDLEKSQLERLSKKPPSNLQYAPGPSDKECEIAEKLTQQLKELTSQAEPGSVASTHAVRNAMGISVPEEPQSTPAEIDITNILSSPANTPSHMSAEEEAEIDRELREFLESPSMSTDTKD
ncbi:bromodomain-containing protein 7-like [Ptychodera flava]|uniref:bromodomain-containing protein 7-like n=1 Tax=Ptychodera flava TaxID=63121 RepID=UPI00396A97E1